MKNKIYWIILGIIIVIGVIVTVVLVNKNITVEEFITPIEEEIEVKLEMGIGYSVEKNEKEAVQEAYTKMVEQLKGEEPVFAILTSTVGYNQDEILAEVNQLLPNTKIYGSTSLMGIMTNSGFHIGEKVEEGNVLSLMGFSSEEMIFGVGACNLDEVVSSEEAGKVAIIKAIENAGKTIKDLPKVVLMSSSPFGIGEEMVIKGIESVLGKDILIVGGGATAGYSDLVSGGEALFANNKVYSRGIVVAPIYTDLKVGHAFLSGFNQTGQKGIVTKFRRDDEGLNIVEIDNKPAAIVYNNWLDGFFDKYLGTSEMILAEAVNHTFGKKMIETDGFSNWQMIVPFHFNPDNSITVGAVAEEGTELYLLESNPELFIQRAALAVKLAQSRGGITEKEIAGAVLDQCGGTLLGIGDPEGWDEMVSKIVLAVGDNPFLGVSNLGPYGHFVGIGNKYGEVTASILIFSKD